MEVEGRVDSVQFLGMEGGGYFQFKNKNHSGLKCRQKLIYFREF